MKPQPSSVFALAFGLVASVRAADARVWSGESFGGERQGFEAARSRAIPPAQRATAARYCGERGETTAVTGAGRAEVLEFFESKLPREFLLHAPPD